MPREKIVPKGQPAPPIRCPLCTIIVRDALTFEDIKLSVRSFEDSDAHHVYCSYRLVKRIRLLEKGVNRDRKRLDRLTKKRSKG